MGSRRHRANATIVRPAAECGGVAGGAAAGARLASLVCIGVAMDR